MKGEPPLVTLPATDAEPRHLVRPLTRAQVAGVAAGLADQTGLSPLVLRAIFVLLAAWQGVGVAAYLALWLAIPPATGSRVAPGVDAASRQGLRTQEDLSRASRPDLGQLAAFALVGAGLLWLVQTLGWGLPPRWLLIAGLFTAALGLVWWHADRAVGTPSEAASGWRGFSRALLAHWSPVLSHVAAVLALVVSVTLTMLQVPFSLGTLPGLLLAFGLLVGGLGLLALPWVLRARRALVQVREGKLLSDARADMAAHLHDSVLQTLALIQRQADNPREVVRLARRQERELREWLYGADEQAATLRAALLEAAGEVEDRFPVSVECVTVGDCDLTPALGELVKAAREAMVNAAKHSGSPLVDVYAEVGDELVEVFVRDRGQGFDSEAIADDRLGVRGSILERMARHHGVARIRSSPERGTEVSLEMRRTRE